MLPTEVMSDIRSKMSFMEQVYRDFYLYRYFTPAFSSSVGGFIEQFTFLGIAQYLENGIPVEPKFDFEGSPELKSLLSKWHSLNFNGTLLYRGTSYRFVSTNDKPYYTSGGTVRVVNGDRNLLTYWSYNPASALYFSAGEIEPVMLVIPFNPIFCSPDIYFIPHTEISGLIDGRLYNYGGVQFFRETEVRCYSYPVGETKYVLHKSDLIELLKILKPVYDQYPDPSFYNSIKKGLGV